MTTPWALLFDTIESQAAAGVVLRALEPLPADGRVTLEGEADSFESMAAYLSALNSRGLGPVQLVKQEPLAGSERVKFTATGAWGHQVASVVNELQFSELSAPDELASLSAEWLAQAKVAGLNVKAIEHEWMQISDDVSSATLSFEAQGDYRAAREFVNRALANHRSTALRRFSLQSAPSTIPPSGAPMLLQARIDLVVFTHGGRP